MEYDKLLYHKTFWYDPLRIISIEERQQILELVPHDLKEHNSMDGDFFSVDGTRAFFF